MAYMIFGLILFLGVHIVPMAPDYLVRQDGPVLTLKNFRGEAYQYTEGHDPAVGT